MKKIFYAKETHMIISIKRTFLTGILATTLTMSAPAIVSATSSVWKISKNKQHLFIGGTIHILSADDYPLPCEFDAAYSVSDKVFFETDISPDKLAKASIDMLTKGTYPVGETIANHLSEPTAKQLKSYIASLGMPAEQFMSFKPGILMSITAIAELSKIGIKAEGVDQFLFNRAKQDNKPTDYFEEISEQIDFLVNLGVGNEENFIKYSLENSKNLESQFVQMRENWRNGELEQLANISKVDELREKFPKVFSTLLTNRNQQWLKRIDSLIESAEIEYILVGALHLTEEEGLLAKLEAKGYQITQAGCEYKKG